jgi:hypothetical protein
MLAAAATVAANPSAPAPERPSGAITVSIDALDSYVPELNAAYWMVDDPSVDVPVILSEPYPEGPVNIPFVANTMSSALLFPSQTTRRTYTITYTTGGGKPFYPGWFLDFAYFSLLPDQPPGIERGVPFTLYPIHVREASAAAPAGIACDVDWVCAWARFLGLVPFGDCGAEAGAASARRGTGQFVPTLQRYRDEILQNTPAGRYYVGLHEQHSLNVIRTIANVPSLAARIILKKTAWVDGLQALVDGQGSQFTVTQQMQDDLLELLQAFEQNGPPALATMISTERTRLQLDTIAGQTMTQYQTQIETLGPQVVDERSWSQMKRIYAEPRE